MKNRLRDLMACGCILGGAATTVLGQILIDDKPEVGFLAIFVGFVLFASGMGIALISIGKHFLTNGFEVLNPRPDAMNQSEELRRWRPWAEFSVFSFVFAYSTYLAVYEHAIWGWSATLLAAGVLFFTGWQLLAVWRNWP